MEDVALAAHEIHEYMARRVSNHADAEDLAQKTLLLACEHLGTFRNGNLRAWLFAIARHVIVDHYRVSSRFQFVDIESPTLGSREVRLRTSRHEVPDTCERRDRLRRYLFFTLSLPPEQQVAVLLAEVHGYRDRESAEMLEVSLASFKLLLHGARAHLRGLTRSGILPAQHSLGAQRTGEPRVTETDGYAHRNNARSAELSPGPVSSFDTPCVIKGATTQSAYPCRCDLAPKELNPTPCLNCPLGDVCRHISEGRQGECRFGLRCCRVLPKLLALREKLLESLRPYWQFV